MSILCWDKPEKIMTEEKRRERYSSDSEIPGTYFPNMSARARKKWKARLVGHRAGHPQVEIRKDTMVIIVSLGGGYRYKYYKPEETEGINLHIASAGPVFWTFKDLDDFSKAIEEAKEALMKL